MSKKIFIAEDDADVVEVLKEGLEGYEIFSASNGAEALEVMKKEKPALAVIDIMMPEMNGAELNKKMKKDPNLKNVPVVIITGRPNMKDLFSANGENSVAGFLEKPFTLKVLQREIDRHLEKTG